MKESFTTNTQIAVDIEFKGGYVKLVLGHDDFDFTVEDAEALIARMQKVIAAAKENPVERTVETALPGIFTPIGEVLCLNCHGPELKFGYGGDKKNATAFVKRWAQRNDLIEGQRDTGDNLIEGITQCDNCCKEIWVRKDVAAIKEFGLACDDAEIDEIAGFEMHQAGGMLCAFRINILDTNAESVDALVSPKFLYVTDGTLAGKEALAMGLYENEEQFEEGTAKDFLEFTDHTVGLAKIREWVKPA